MCDMTRVRAVFDQSHMYVAKLSYACNMTPSCV